MAGEQDRRDPVAWLRAATQARIGLERAGHALPTRPMLAFQWDHARARDAVHGAIDPDRIAAALSQPPIVVNSQATDRTRYLTRPDLGRRLDAESKAVLKRHESGFDLAIVLADGLSAAAVQAHGAAMVELIGQALPDWRIAPPIIARQARVALGDEVGEALGAAMVLVLIGERPGLSSPDSLGAYLTASPRVGRRDSERNCISNIRPPHGLSYRAAADTILWLMRQVRLGHATGVSLKDLRDDHASPVIEG
ncbi:ethanolamine ammonia-lyase subunit EutC [Sphingomonas fuzhouensis]|uniref:ethanolamine ammonia-lyase subunit EutC n=1 Tax=Sphingomonas fuzhouensis TaxID=3106033 RepID=UPI002B000CFB|nr:ethanolamine ammonia-lyase subunit EutC [Sphingomonas sp. SGZ-02]